MDELRKRWQDAVRRSDSLTLDMRESTLPLLKQIENLEQSKLVLASTSNVNERKLRDKNDQLSGELLHLSRSANDLTSTNSELSQKLSLAGEQQAKRVASEASSKRAANIVSTVTTSVWCSERSAAEDAMACFGPSLNNPSHKNMRLAEPATLSNFERKKSH